MTGMDPLEARVARVAARQHGVVSRRQLRALGASDTQVTRWAAKGRLHRILHRVYAVGHPEVGALGTAMAAVLSTGGVLSHRSAAALFDIRPYTGPPEVTVRRSGARRRRGIRMHVSRVLPAADVATREGIPVTTPARTLLDLAASGVRGRSLEAALDRAEQLRLLDFAELHRLLARYPRRPGTRLLGRAALGALTTTGVGKAPRVTTRRCGAAVRAA
jgi:predicted transcriptional regulator of viral defense system